MFHGRVWKFGDDVDTDVIIPSIYVHRNDKALWASHCLEGLDPDFSKKARAGDIIVGGSNFGCGSSREQAPWAIKALGISCVVAASFARIFLRNSINIGLPLLVCPEAVNGINQGDEVEIDPESGRITDLTTRQTFQAEPFPEFLRQMIAVGGLVNYVRQRLGVK